MKESLVPIGRPPEKYHSSQPERNEEQNDNQPSTSSNEQSTNKNGPNEQRIPMLIRGIGVHTVIPKEATRDVLAGKAAFYLVDDKEGVTLFPPKHIFTALKLDREHIKKFEDYTCLGAHQRLFEKRPKKREGFGYRRKYISSELLQRGIYAPDGQYMGTARGRAMSSGALFGGYAGPRF